MKLYTKPVVTIDSGLAEGVYAASGAGDNSSNNISISFLRYDGDWGNGGTAVYNADLSNITSEPLTVLFTFNMNISGGWSNGASNESSGNTLKLTWHNNIPSSAEIFVQVQGADIKQLKCTGATYSNS